MGNYPGSPTQRLAKAALRMAAGGFWDLLL